MYGCSFLAPRFLFPPSMVCSPTLIGEDQEQGSLGCLFGILGSDGLDLLLNSMLITFACN